MPLIVFPLPFTKMTDTINMNINENMNENMTTGQRIVREAMEPEEVQLAQIRLNGGFVYDVCWLPQEWLVRIETGLDRKGEPNYLWYSDNSTIGSTLARVIGCEEDKIRIWGLKVFNDEGVTDALSYETRGLNQNTWHDYASEGYALQFHVQTRCHHNEGDVECCPQTCGKGMTESAFCAQLAKVVAQNEALESLKQYSSDAEMQPEETDEAASEAGEEEPDKAAILEAARAMWQRWAQKEDAPEEVRAMWQRWAEKDATPEPEPEVEAEKQATPETEAEAEEEAEEEPESEAEEEPESEAEAESETYEEALKDDAAFDLIEARLLYVIIFLLGFVVAMLLKFP
jgi:hypothetical protein